jgi:beta-galactosidase
MVKHRPAFIEDEMNPVSEGVWARGMIRYRCACSPFQRKRLSRTLSTHACRTLILLILCVSAFGGLRFDKSIYGQSDVPSRTVLNIDAGWRFSRGDFAGAAMPSFDDSGWQRVELPHDWSSDGPFQAAYGSGNGYAPGGIGWYRYHFNLPSTDLKNGLAAVEFDGIYDFAEVWFNGHFVGSRPYGYSSFECQVTPHLKPQGDNVIAVRVDHSRYADSRWYTGSGIYRHARLRFENLLHIGRWGTYVTTPAVNAEAAVVRVETAVENASNRQHTFLLESEVLDGENVVAKAISSGTADVNASRTLTQDIKLAKPHIWSVVSPSLYTVRQRVSVDSRTVDEVSTSFGIRTLRFDPDQGLLLNGTPTKLKGVCVHHDAGSLGAAVPESVWERRLRALKELGVNAIRTSHNPPAPEFLDLCDRLGLLVKDEAFDEFTPPKNKWVEGWNAGVPSRFGYGEIFSEWAITDVQDMVRRDRNHPSIIMWSIGNEIDYPNDPFSHPVLKNGYRPENPPADNLVKHGKPLIEAVRKWDPTRPVTAALASLAMSDAVGFPDLLDVVGYNYQESRYAEDHRRFPHRVLFGSENDHTYGNWTVVRDNPFVAGQFLWTGIDYLGEARIFPNRANGAGLLDLCGFKKPAAWFRQSLWSKDPMVYLCASAAGNARARAARVEEHWNWPAGSTVAVSCYTNCAEVSLTLNDQLLGKKKLAEGQGGFLTWDVPFAPGILRASGFSDGKQAAVFELKTAEKTSRLSLNPDVTRMGSRGICQVEFKVLDANGVWVANADVPVTFEIDGPARLLGLGNGDLNSVEDCKDLSHRAYQGRGLAILQATGPGTFVVTAASPGLAPVSLTLINR